MIKHKVIAIERQKEREMKQGKNVYGVDMHYLHKWFSRSLNSLENYTKDELARELARMAKTVDQLVLSENEFNQILPISNIQKSSIIESDTLIVKMDKPISQEIRKSIMGIFKGLFPKNKVIILNAGVELEIISSGDLS